MARVASPLHIKARPAGDAGRFAAIDAVDLAVVRTCQHHSPLAYAVAVIRWGAGASSDVLRERARCTECGRKGASLQHPSWAGEHLGFEPFPERLSSA